MAAPDQSALERAIARIRAFRDRELSRCAKACFLDGITGIPTAEGERLLAELRDVAKLFRSGIVKDRHGAIDRDELLRIEGRREVVLWLTNLLNVDPRDLAQLVEVDRQ